MQSYWFPKTLLVPGLFDTNLPLNPRKKNSTSAPPVYTRNRRNIRTGHSEAEGKAATNTLYP